MKVLQINSVCGIRSTGRIATDIYNILMQQGHDCKVAYGRELPHNIEKEDVIQIGTELGVKMHALLSRVTDKTGFYSKTATKRFINQIEEYNPDVIHLHNIHGYYLNIEILFDYLAKTNKKVIWTMHDCWAITGHCAYFDMANCNKWETGCNNCPQKNKYPTSYVCDNSKSNWIRKKELFTRVKDLTIVTPSKWLADIMKTSYLGKYPVKVINNGIDLNSFKPIPSDFKKNNNIENKKIILGVAAIWDERKGLADFLKLSEMINDEYKIVLVGIPENKMADLPENILPISRTNSVKELAEIYTSADVFANPTYEDNFPTVNLESIACGTPVITYNTGGSPEGINETCGIVTEQKTPDALWTAVQKVCEENIFPAEDCIAYAKTFDKTDKFMEYICLYAE